MSEDYIIDYISGTEVKSSPEEVEAVQPFSIKLVEEYGYKKSQIQTRPQFRVRERPSGKDTYPVDIAVFNDDNKYEDNLSIVVECKRKTRKDGEKQLKAYMRMSSAQIGIWYNGKDHLYLQKIIGPDGRIKYKEIYTIPKRGQRLEDIGKYKVNDLIRDANLKMIFKDLRDHLAGNLTGITRDEVLAQEMINLLFCKIHDEINTPIDENVRFRVGINEDDKDVYQRIKELFNEVKEEYDDVFEKQDRIGIEIKSLIYIVGELQNYSILSASRDVLGDAFEIFIGPAIRGPEGQFFTPRNVVKMAIKMIDPDINEYIIDPACGSGGFLIIALEYVWEKIKKQAKKSNWSDSLMQKRFQDVATKYFRGIDKDRFLSKITKAYMAIIGDGKGGIFCENSLNKRTEWKNATKEKIQFGGFDVLLTNPPFGSKIPVRGYEILQQYDLAYKWKKDKDFIWTKTNTLESERPPQILFIERCLDLLKEGGRLAIVLPDGILGNVNDGYIRQFILSKAKIFAIVDLPTETFKLPNSRGTSTKTSVLFLKKLRKEEKITDYKIFIASVEKCGHDRRGKEIPEDDLPEVINKFIEFRKQYDPF